MRKLDLEPKEVIRRFFVSSAFESNQVIIIGPDIEFKRLAYYPYTRGETSWEVICDLSKFADTTVVTAAPRYMTCKLAECSMHRYDHRLQLYLHPSPPLILISDTEAIKCDDVCILTTAEEEEYSTIKNEAAAIIRRSKQVDYGMYLDLCGR